MKRIIFAVAMLCVATPVAAQDMKAECAIQGVLAQSVADEKLAGTRKRKAERMILKGLSEDAQKYKTVVPMLVDYVYEQLPAAMVTEDFGATWETQCLEAQ